MPGVLSLTESVILKTLRVFLEGILPAGVVVQKAQVNRVAEPASPDFVLMTPTLRIPLSTSVGQDSDVKFTGSITAGLLTVTHVDCGALIVGSTIFGTNVADGTVVASFGTGTGGVGTYHVTPSQTVGSETMSAGTLDLSQSVQVKVQLDVHGPNSADNAQRISTVLRSAYAARQFKATGNAVAPLYASEPRQTPFANDQQQTEFRWIVDADLVAKPVVSVPQEFFDSANIGASDVDADFPS